MLRFRVFKDKTHFNFMGVHKLTFAGSLIMTTVVFVLLFTRGLNLGIDFTGGILMEVKIPSTMHIEDVRNDLKSLSAGVPTIQEFGADAIMIKIPGKESDSAAQKALHVEVQTLLGP